MNLRHRQSQIIRCGRRYTVISSDTEFLDTELTFGMENHEDLAVKC